jgi:hypothetical protein
LQPLFSRFASADAAYLLAAQEHRASRVRRPFIASRNVRSRNDPRYAIRHIQS